jgi:hypothetical protein
MTLAVVFCVAGLAAAFVALGGTPPAPAPTQFVVLTAPPDRVTGQTRPQDAALGTPVVGSAPVNIGAPLVLSGPTLPAIVFTATPMPLMIGATALVVDVGDQQLNVRERAGIVDVAIAFRIPEGTTVQVIDGPSQGDGLTWWRIQDSSGRNGWAASNYLQPIAPTAP